MLAIGADNQGDAFYRYKMPKLQAKIEGRGNGIKTNVVNNVDIAKALERPPGYIIKYFGCELGAQTKYEEASGTSIVNGAHDASKLSELLEGFIKRYVQCYSCGNPETQVKIKKELISLKCKACGHVSQVDPRHKLNTYILNHPPENKMSKEEKKLKKAEEERLKIAKQNEEKDREKKKDKKKDKDKKDKKDKKRRDTSEKADTLEKSASQEDDDDSPADDDEDDGVVWMTDTSKAAAEKRAQEQLTSATAAMVTVGNIEAEEEEARKKAEKEAKKKAEEEAKRKAEEEARRAEELARQAQRITLDDIPAERVTAEKASEIIRSFLAEGNLSQVEAAVKKLNVEGGIPGRMRALYEVVLGEVPEAKRLAPAIKAKVTLFRALAKDTPSQIAQLIALEHYFTVTCPDRLKEAPVVIKMMYDEEIVQDGVILGWHGRGDAARILHVPADGARLVRKQVDQLAAWLEQDEDEDDDDEDEDDE